MAAKFHRTKLAAMAHPFCTPTFARPHLHAYICTPTFARPHLHAYQSLDIMPACPRCDRTLLSTAITCPHCQLQLKAHGHPGMSLNRTKDNRILCATCLYDADDSCNFSKRPNATSCTLYQNSEENADISIRRERKPLYTVPWWRQSTQPWLAVGLLIAISILIAIF